MARVHASSLLVLHYCIHPSSQRRCPCFSSLHLSVPDAPVPVMSSSPCPSPLRPPSFCHFRPSICSSFHSPPHPSARPCVVLLSSRLHPSVSLSLHLSTCHPFAASNHPITSPSPLVHMSFSLLSVGLTVHCQTTEDTAVAPCCHSLRAGSLHLFLILLIAEPPPPPL